ncbi:MAG: hypothetical protein QM831_05515 [Kofleriaceae bacterium]
MASVMAIVSKAVFEKAARDLGEGDVWDTDHYASANKGLAPLADGGSLYLVTVRPGEVLWLVAVLNDPEQTKDGWGGAANTRPIGSIDSVRSLIKFESGTGITAKAGALGMSLQTPRVLTEDDVMLLDGAAAVPAKKKSKAKPDATSKAKPDAATSKAKPDATSKAKSGSKANASAATQSDARSPKPSAKLAAPPKPKPGATLADALALATDDDWDSALATLLAIWRDAPNPALADAICAIGAMLPKTEIEPFGWLSFGNGHHPRHLDSLLAAMFDKGSVKARDYLEALARWDPDPRIDRWVAGLFEKPVFSSTGARPMWTRVQPLLKRIIDQSSIARIEAARPTWKRGGWDFLVEYADRAKLVAQPIADVDAQSLAKLQPLLGTASAKPPEGKRADALLATYLADPNPEALPVLADALIEAGDPRGEVINTQLAGKNADALIKKHLDHLLGPLAGAIVNPTFEGGFLVRCKLRETNTNSKAGRANKECVGHPLWATVRSLDGAVEDYDIVRHPVMKNIVELADTACDLAFVSKLPRLEKLVQSIDHTKELAAVLGKGWPVLKELVVPTIRPEDAVTVIESALARKLARLVIIPSLHDLRHYEQRDQIARDERAQLAKLVTGATKLSSPVLVELRRADGVHAKIAIQGSAIEVSIVDGRRDAQANTAQPEVLADVIAAVAKRKVTLAKPPTSPKQKKALESALLTT